MAQKFISFFVGSYGKNQMNFLANEYIKTETYNSEENPKYCWEEIIKHLNKEEVYFIHGSEHFNTIKVPILPKIYLQI